MDGEESKRERLSRLLSMPNHDADDPIIIIDRRGPKPVVTLQNEESVLRVFGTLDVRQVLNAITERTRKAA